MKTKFFGIFALSLLAHIAMADEAQLPHFDLDMTSEEYRAALSQPQYKNKRHETEPEGAVEEALRIGTRNLDWLKAVNATRPIESQLQLSSPQTQRGIPIDSPKIYSDKTVAQEFEAFKASVPAAIKDILFSSGSVPNTLPVDDETFLEFSKQINKIYDTAGRWKLLQPYILVLAERKQNDVRGVYYLSKEVNLAAALADIGSMETQKATQLKTWLTNICYNSTGDEDSCLKTVEKLVADHKDLNPFYKKYIADAEALWNSFFEIERRRSDIEWKPANPNLASIPFYNPRSVEVQDFLKVNIEDEWKFNGWNLAVNFVNSRGFNTPYIEFVPGITANAQLAGARIQMDANMPLTEYTMRWTIRHEFGHTLGFPDCYVEFYDSMQNAMVNYQLDIENLMCSRRGHLNEGMFNEFKKAYYRD